MTAFEALEDGMVSWRLIAGCLQGGKEGDRRRRGIEADSGG